MNDLTGLQQMGATAIAFLVKNKKGAFIALFVAVLIVVLILAMNAVKPKKKKEAA